MLANVHVHEPASDEAKTAKLYANIEDRPEYRKMPQPCANRILASNGRCSQGGNLCSKPANRSILTATIVVCLSLTPYPHSDYAHRASSRRSSPLPKRFLFGKPSCCWMFALPIECVPHSLPIRRLSHVYQLIGCHHLTCAGRALGLAEHFSRVHLYWPGVASLSNSSDVHCSRIVDGCLLMRRDAPTSFVSPLNTD